MGELVSLMRSLSMKLSFLRQVFTPSPVGGFGAGKGVTEIGLYKHHVARLGIRLVSDERLHRVLESRPTAGILFQSAKNSRASPTIASVAAAVTMMG